MENTSAIKLWKAFQEKYPSYKEAEMPPIDHFCDNELDANVCAELVLEGKKVGTCGALISYEKDNVPLPQKGNLWIITDWFGEAKCIIETQKTFLCKFNEVDEAWAKMEGEGDLSLAYWQRVHRAFFTRELSEKGLSFSEDLELFCEVFKRVF